MSITSGATNLKAWHTSIVLYFLVFGLAPASLIVRLPLVRELVNVTTAELGIILLCGSFGAILSVTQAGRLIAKFGTRASIIFGSTLVLLGLVGQAFAIVNHSAPGYALLAFIAGLGMGIADVGINVDGAAIETASSKTVLPKMHAAFSIGTFIGAAIGTLASRFEVNLLAQMSVVAGITVLLPLFTAKYLSINNGKEDFAASGSSEATKEPKVAVWRNRTVVYLSIAILGLTLAEGASNDWLTIALVDDFDQTATMAGIGYAILLAAMTLTRFFGGNLADKFGRVLTLQVCAFTGVAGMLLIILSGNVYVAFVGAAMWGCGVALGFPLLLSAAGEGENAARKVAFVASSGYMAFLVGPPLLGFLGQAWGLTNMFYVIAAFMLVSAFFARGASETKA